MRPFSIILFVVLLMVAEFSVAFATPYVSGNLGYTWLEDSDMQDHGSEAGDLAFDKGLLITVSVGNALGNGLRPEIEFGYRTNEADELKAPGGEKSDTDTDILNLSLMANCFYDFMPSSMVCPFVGAGIGIANVDGEVNEDTNDKDNVFAYQLTAGVAFAVSDKMKIDAQYRFFGTDDPEFKNLEAEYAAHNLMLGLRFSF